MKEQVETTLTNQNKQYAEIRVQHVALNLDSEKDYDLFIDEVYLHDGFDDSMDIESEYFFKISPVSMIIIVGTPCRTTVFPRYQFKKV